MSHRCNPAEPCDWCESLAEAMAADIEPDYDLDGAANQYERQFDQ